MEEASFGDLLIRIKEESFDTYQCIEQFKIHCSNIGATHLLVQKLKTFQYLDLEFYIPQFVQLLVSFETDSMALSDLLLEYSRKFPHFCLITFWHLQSYMFELKDSPDSYSFHIVRSFINDIQNIMFNHEPDHHHQQPLRFRENTHPAIVLSGAIAGAFALPELIPFIKPVVISQSKQQKSFLFKLANFHKTLTNNLTMKNRAISLEASGITDKSERAHIAQSRHSEGNRPTLTRNSSQFDDFGDSHSDTELLDRELHISTIIKSKKSQLLQRRTSAEALDLDYTSRSQDKVTSFSLPDLRNNSNGDDYLITRIISNGSSFSSMDQVEETPSFTVIPELDDDQKVKHLYVNYFKRETEFIMTLQNLSARLSHVPKEARLTTLRAELSIINNTLLPSEIDIPQLLPISSQQNKKYHRILRLNVNEACVLNSAERVPFLLLIEYLSEEMDFDPQSEHNKSILSDAVSNTSHKSMRRFQNLSNTGTSSSDGKKVLDEEEDLGDISMVAISNERTFMTQQLSLMRLSDLPRSTSRLHSPALSPKVTSNNPDPNFSTRNLSAQMRIAVVMLRQLEKSGQANSEQAASIKARIIDSMKGLQDKFETIGYDQINEINSVDIGQTVPDAGERKLENDFKLGEDWQTKKERIRKSSAYGHMANWELCSVIAKNGDDLPQEAFACQLISIMSKIWKTNKVGVWTKNMKILVTGANSGLVETINNAMSVHSIKKSLTELSVKNGENSKGTVVSIRDYFHKVYGNETSAKYKRAQENFARSLAAYSIICYVLQIKDRHNGNIMLDSEGHIIHIDFGFLLSNSPGSVGFEAAPFKLTQEYVDVLGGFDSPVYKSFKELCKKSFQVLRKNCDQLVNLVDLMLKDSSLPCFRNGSQTSILLKQRLQPELTDDESDTFVETALIGKSIGSVYTRLYDQFQLLTQGIYA